MKTGPIVIIEDDADDIDIFKQVLADLEVKNEPIWFKNGIEAMQYLTTTDQAPFIIICDVNLPRLNGVEFKRQLDANPILRRKSIPFVFYSTIADQDVVTTAYTELTVQGFFVKETNYQSIKGCIKMIVDYWKACRHPNAMG